MLIIIRNKGEKIIVGDRDVKICRTRQKAGASIIVIILYSNEAKLLKTNKID